MKEIRDTKNKITFEGQNGQTISFNKRNPYEHRQRYALRLGAKFLIKNSEEVLNLMGVETSEELDVFKNPLFKKMTRALKDGHVGREDFTKEMAEIISTSTHRPAEIQAHLIAGSFTSYVYREIERLGLERKAKA